MSIRHKINTFQNKSWGKKNKHEMSNRLKGINSRIIKAEEQISDLEDRMVEINTAKQITEE